MADHNGNYNSEDYSISPTAAYDKIDNKYSQLSARYYHNPPFHGDSYYNGDYTFWGKQTYVSTSGCWSDENYNKYHGYAGTCYRYSESIEIEGQFPSGLAPDLKVMYHITTPDDPAISANVVRYRSGTYPSEFAEIRFNFWGGSENLQPGYTTLDFGPLISRKCISSKSIKWST